MKIKVKLTYPYQWPDIKQQLPSKLEWGNCEFYINDEIDECDVWVVFNHLNALEESAVCNRSNTLLIAPEPHPVNMYYSKFIHQFKHIQTCQKEIVHPNKHLVSPSVPWWLDKTYTELAELTPPLKTKKISLITSNKLISDGHKKRYEFAHRLKEKMGDDLDLFGRGIQTFDHKWDVLINYQYNICIENGRHYNYFTEKLYDCLLTYTFPFYNGCTNIEDHFARDSMEIIDINNFDKTLSQIESVLNQNHHYDEHIPALVEARKLILNKYNIFSVINDFVHTNLNETINAKKEKIVLKNQFRDPSSVAEKAFYLLKKKLKGV